MKNWLDAANRLRAARQAREEFLMREFVDRSIIGPMLLDRLAADLCSGGRGRLMDMPSVQSETWIADDRYLE